MHAPEVTRSCPGLRRSPVHALGLVLLGISVASAQSTAQKPEPALTLPLDLQSSFLLQEKIFSSARKLLPIFISGQQVTGRTDQEVMVQGSAQLRRGDLVIKAEQMEYDQSSDLAKARGKVYINRAGNLYEGPLLELKLGTFEGFLQQPHYRFLQNDIQGEADRIDFISDSKAVVHNASFSSCKRLPGSDWLPGWLLRADTLGLDSDKDEGTAQGALLSFQGLPLLPIPYLSFPLSDKRKSGFMPPTPGLDNVNGAELSLPYYWNIAPNRDATLTPTVMSKRGVNLGGELRYLEPDFFGQLRLDWMPADQLRQRDRWDLSLRHQQVFNNPLTRRLSDNGVAMNVNLNRASDDDYWRDFTRTATSLTQRLLANDATWAWTDGAFSSRVRTLKWQTLQDVSAPITPPYDRLPQFSTSYARSSSGFDYSLDLDYTRFQADPVSTGQVNAQRVFSMLKISRPWNTPAGFIKPKIELHASSYQFDAPLSNGAQNAQRVVPTLSLDSGLVFERDASYFGRSFRQTLEPRAFYVNTPYRDQNGLPNYDSAANDFNFSALYSENAFVGDDRISDSNLLTLGLTTRLLNPDSGAEAARFGVAQRLRFKDQNVTLPQGSAVADRLSDILLGTTVNWATNWALDSTVQFNPKNEQSVRATLGASYRPGNYRSLNAGYRFQRDASEQLDLGWQWPLNDLWGEHGQDLGAGRGQGSGRWYSVGRLNYSLSESKLVNAMLGFEYDGGCWLGRIVLERLQTSASAANQRVMFQLEFVGFTRLGANPLKTLKDNVPGYQYLREQTSTPSRFSNYD